MRRKTFTPEFKQECVNLVLQHKYPVIQAAKTMNIGLSTFQPFNAGYGSIAERSAGTHR
ncbi:IS1329 transposase A [Yersinia aleksiciae]|nr:IS1329 transposase A [Yersinia aleksiciae]